MRLSSGVRGAATPGQAGGRGERYVRNSESFGRFRGGHPPKLAHFDELSQ